MLVFFQIGVKRTKRSEPGYTLPYTPEVNSYNAPPAQVHHGDNAYAPIPPYPHVQPYHAVAQNYHPVQPYYKPKEIKFDDAPEMVYGWVIRTRSFTPCKGEIKKECDRLEREGKVVQCNIPRFRYEIKIALLFHCLLYIFRYIKYNTHNNIMKFSVIVILNGKTAS